MTLWYPGLPASPPVAFAASLFDAAASSAVGSTQSLLRIATTDTSTTTHLSVSSPSAVTMPYLSVYEADFLPDHADDIP